MLKFQMALIAILIGCLAFISCDLLPGILTPTPPEEDTPDDSMMMGLPMYISMYTSWMTSVELPAPGPLADATAPAETGEVHGMGTRTAYINEVGAMALKDMSMTAYPAGTIIVKAIMDDANMFVQKVATMMKTDDPMYAAHNGWTYKKYARPDGNADYMQVKGDGLPDAAEGCHGCHAKADTDSVFVFSMDSTTIDDGMPTDDSVMADYASWMNVTYAAVSPAHGPGDRIVYINDTGAMALQDVSMTAFPVGTVIVKEIMDATNTSVAIVERMEKTDDPMYADAGRVAIQRGCYSSWLSRLPRQSRHRR